MATVAAGFYMAEPLSSAASWLVLVHAMIGSAFVAGGTNALNQVAERDLDALMRRTANRPLPSGRLSFLEAASFAWFGGVAGIAYLAVVRESADVQRSEVRFARAKTAAPAAASDWELVIVDSQPFATETEAEMSLDDAPRIRGLFITTARKPDGSPVVAYHDRIGGTLRVAAFDATTQTFGPPQTLSRPGAAIGWSPALGISAAGVISVAYVDVTRGALMLQTLPAGTPELVDDGYRTDGMTADGLPRPVRHRIGDDAALVVTGNAVAVVYQDATSHELLLAVKRAGGWEREAIAGAETAFAGAYGFHAAARASGGDLVMSSYAFDLARADSWVEVFRQPLVIE